MPLQRTGTTPLFVAAQGGHLGCVQALLGAGADPLRAAAQPAGATPLSAAQGPAVLAALRAAAPDAPSPAA